MADRLATDGFRDAGYKLIGIDDCWLLGKRDSEGRLQADPARFPSGIKRLAQHVHDLNLEFGIYGDIGSHTCGGFAGMAGHFEMDAQTFADWGVDYLKVDGCYADPEDLAVLYPRLGRQLNKTGRPITYSCSWPAYLPDPVATGFQIPYEALKEHCNMWRNWLDIQDSYDSLAGILRFWAEASRSSSGFQSIAGPGAWNDPDMLIIGNRGLNTAQSAMQMGMWAMFAAPLLMSNDLRNLSDNARSILLDRAAIAINQDPLGEQGTLAACKGDCGQVQLWRRRLAGGAAAAAFLNLSDESFNERLCVELDGVLSGAMTERLDSLALKVTGVLDPVEATPPEVVGSSVCVRGLDATSLRLFRVALARANASEGFA